MVILYKQFVTEYFKSLLHTVKVHSKKMSVLHYFMNIMLGTGRPGGSIGNLETF